MAMRPWGVQMCLLIRFPYLQAAHLQSSRARSGCPRSRLNHRHKQEQTTTTAGLLFFLSLIGPYNESCSRVRRQLYVITLQTEREGEKKRERASARVRKMNRMSWHRPLTALSLCPIKAVIYDHVSSICDAAKAQTHTASRGSISLTVHSLGTNHREKTPNLEVNLFHFLVCLQWKGESRMPTKHSQLTAQ